MLARTQLSRRRFLAAAAAIAVVPAVHLTGPATAQSTDSAIVNANGLRLRSGPGLDFRVLASLDQGTLVRYLADGGWAGGYRWNKILVESTGREGFVAAVYLSTPDTGPYPNGSTFHVDTSGGSGANLRNAASISAGVLRVIPNGTNGTILSNATEADGYTWRQVRISETVGWMASVVIAPGPNYTGRPGIEVGDGPLNVRQSPGLDGQIVTSVPTGATGEITTAMPEEEDGYVWVNVRFFNQANTTGWVASEFLVWT